MLSLIIKYLLVHDTICQWERREYRLGNKF